MSRAAPTGDGSATGAGARAIDVGATIAPETLAALGQYLERHIALLGTFHVTVSLGVFEARKDATAGYAC